MTSSLSLAQVFEKAGSANISYVYEAPIHYIVLNRKDNTFDGNFLRAYDAILDQIEATKGPGILVTIGTGKKLFSTGFDLDYWCVKYENYAESAALFNQLMARLLEFPIPTLCVFNGSALAGGFLFGLCHDARIMNEAVGNICLSEIKLGIALPLPMMLLVKAKLAPNVCSQLARAIQVLPGDAVRYDLIDSTYLTIGSLEEQITEFTKLYA